MAQVYDLCTHNSHVKIHLANIHVYILDMTFSPTMYT